MCIEFYVYTLQQITNVFDMYSSTRSEADITRQKYLLLRAIVISTVVLIIQTIEAIV